MTEKWCLEHWCLSVIWTPCHMQEWQIARKNGRYRVPTLGCQGSFWSDCSVWCIRLWSLQFSIHRTLTMLHFSTAQCIVSISFRLTPALICLTSVFQLPSGELQHPGRFVRGLRLHPHCAAPVLSSIRAPHRLQKTAHSQRGFRWAVRTAPKPRSSYCPPYALHIDHKE